MMRIVLALLALIAGVSIGTPLLAATVTVVQGQVLINRGQGYRLVEGSTEANPGDMVVVNPGGLAQIAYPDGCSIQLQPGSIVAIGQPSPCQAQQEQAGQAAGVSGTAIAIGAVVVGGGVAAAVLLSQKDNAASP